jgi:succinate dehydrogenase / fumarate reductase cytochrome b subunit
MTNKRPLSPHLQIYQPQLTSLMSILHRLSGVFLSLGSVVLAYWLIAAASGADSYQQAQDLLGSFLGLLFLFGWSFALFYHLCNGIRHLFWDIGLAMDIKMVYLSGKLVLLASVVLTALAWWIAL